MSSSMTGARGRIGAPNSKASSGLQSAPGYRTYQKFTPEQMQLLQQGSEMVGPDSYLSRLAGGDEELFAQMEAPALRQFSGVQGNLASRFSGMGMGAGKSSGHINSQNAAASDFAMGLQSQRQNLQRQALQDMMSYSQMLMSQDPYAMVQKRQKDKSSGWGGLFGAGVGGLGGFALGGPWGAMQGAQLGYGVGSQF